jgi:hypothetical protein
MTACQEVKEARLESKEPTSVETESVAVHEGVPMYVCVRDGP